MPSPKNLLRIILWLYKTNRAYCTAFVKSLSSQQMHCLFLTDPITTEQILKLLEIKLPTLPLLLGNVISLNRFSKQTFHFDIQNDTYQPQRITQAANSTILDSIDLFDSGSFDQRSRKLHFLITDILSIEQWQTNVDLFIDRVLDKLDNGLYSSIKVEIPTITKANLESQGTFSGTNWPISYPNVGKWRRKSTWSKIYTLARDSFRQQWIRSTSTPRSYTVHIAEDLRRNPLLQILHTITLLRKEATTRLLYSMTQVELLAVTINTISIHKWTVSKQSFDRLLNHCILYDHQVFSLLCPQALCLVSTNPLILNQPQVHFHVAQLVAQAYRKDYEQIEKCIRQKDHAVNISIKQEE